MKIKLRKMTLEDWFLVACGLVFIAILVWFLTGCTQATASTKIDIIWHSGECLLIVEGLTVQQARELDNDWAFKKCDVEVLTEKGASE